MPDIIDLYACTKRIIKILDKMNVIFTPVASMFCSLYFSYFKLCIEKNLNKNFYIIYIYILDTVCRENFILFIQLIVNIWVNL